MLPAVILLGLLVALVATDPVPTEPEGDDSFHAPEPPPPPPTS